MPRRTDDRCRPFQFTLGQVAVGIAMAALLFSHPKFRERWGLPVALIVFLVAGWLLEEAEKKYRRESDDSWYLGHVLWRIQRMFCGIVTGLEWGFLVALFFAAFAGLGGFGIVLALSAIAGGARGLFESYAESPSDRVPTEAVEIAAPPVENEPSTTPTVDRMAPPRQVRRCTAKTGR
jgi:hypothetical protein